MARCRRNVDNFLEACRKIGVEEELICSPADILAYPERDREGEAGIAPLACTVTALLTHATPYSPKDIGDPRCHANGLNPPPIPEDCEDAEEIETSLELNYYNRQPGRYAEDRFISNFNFGFTNNYTIDESEEFHLNYDTVNESPPNVNYSPVYNNDGLRNRGPYYQNNRIQFVTPFCKENAILTSENYEIYDTDEVDYPMQVNNETDLEGRYDREKLNLDLQSNNNAMTPVLETDKEREHRILVTWLCLGTFFVSAILLIIFPL